jgi:type IV secretion system protein VirD4
MTGIPVGFDENGRQLTYKHEGNSSGEGHLFLSAAARTGKMVGILAPALLQYDQGSCIIIDPKGELTAVTGPQRARMGQRVIISNPFNILPDVLAPDTPHHFRGLEKWVTFGAKFSPMAALDPGSDTFGADCDNIADSIVTHEGGDRENHWSDSARGLVAGLIGHLAANEEDERKKTLAMLRRAITSPSMLQRFAHEAQMENAGQDESVAETLEPFADKDAANKGEIASIISTARTQTRFLGTSAIAKSLNGSDFRFMDLRQQPTTVYLVLPVKYLNSCGKWFRLVLASALNELLTETKGLPVLCVLDEFAQLGKLGVVENTLGLAAGLGVQLWPVLQDLTQLKDLYRERWESFLGCAGVQMFFAPREYTTSEEISKLCGETMVKVPSESKNTSKDNIGWKTGTNQGTATSLTQRRALLPQEIRQLPGNEFLMFWDGLPGRFIKAYRKPYWRIPELNGEAGLSAKLGHALYSPNPYYVVQAGGR